MSKAMKAKTTDPTTLLRDRCLSHFTTLRVPVQPEDRLLGAEAGARRERAVARRIRDARFPETKTLESFDSVQRGVM